MYNIPTLSFYPSIKAVINTNLSLTEISQRLSTLVEQFDNNDPTKPYKGEILGTYFKIFRKNDLMERRLRIYTEGNIVENSSGCSIELTSGALPLNTFILFAFCIAGIFPVLFNNSLLSFIIITMIGLVFFLSTAIAKEQGNKHIQLIRKTLESPEGFDRLEFKKADQKQGMRWLAIYAISIVGLILVCIVFAFWMNTWK